jgi:AAHS family 4-hydroxybenzoate transporter-like MFS transporter
MTALATTDDLRRRFDEANMSRTQIGAVALTVILSALDGFDVLSVTFAAPAISRDWGLGKGALGIVLSSGLGGMALGSFLLAPLADMFGRRRLILLSLSLMAIGMALSAMASSLPELAGWRVVTGLGIGACVAVINPIAAEFANARRRSLALAMMAMGYPVGGVVGGLLAAALLALYGWQAIFVAGALAALLLIPVVLYFLPEPLAYLLHRTEPEALTQVNRLLERCGHQPINALPVQTLRTRRGYASVFAKGQRATTIRLALVNMLYAAAVYYVLSWLPQMVADAGFSTSTASLVSATASISGVVGGLLLGWAAQRWGLTRLTVATMAGLGAMIIIFGFAPSVLHLLIPIAGVMGFFLFAGVAGFYATLAVSFTDEARASGSGFVIGAGRISSAIGPLAAGAMFAAGFDRWSVSLVFGGVAIVGAFVLAAHRMPGARA